MHSDTPRAEVATGSDMGLFDNLDGRGIIRAAQTAIVKAGNGMAVLAGDDTLPVEHRNRIRSEQAYVARNVRTMALGALGEWATNATKDATRRLAARETGTAAEETRRNTAEIRIGRMVETTRAQGNTKQTAQDLANRANLAYTAGNLDEADLLSRVSLELGPSRLAEEVAKLVEFDTISGDPARARARRDLEDVQVQVAAGTRDLDLAFSIAMQAATTLGQATGDTHASQVARGEASAMSRRVKLSKWREAQTAGTPYSGRPGLEGSPLSPDVPGSVGPGGA
jgi:hypothetical protein